MIKVDRRQLIIKAFRHLASDTHRIPKHGGNHGDAINL
jgi:hypothetical protein